MTQNTKEGFDPLDPMGMWRTLRDANLDAWAKSMSSMTNTDAYAQAIGVQLDTLLATSAPLQSAIQQAMEQYLAQAQMPSRGEVVSLAERLTNIELRLDDMQFALDAIHAGVQQPAPQATPPADLQATLDEIRTALKQLAPAAPAVPADLQATLDEIRAALKALPAPVAAPADPAPKPAPRSTRKSSESTSS